MLRDDEDGEEDSRRNPAKRLVKRAGFNDVLADFTKASAVLGRGAGLATVGQDDGGQEPAKTLKEILEEREEQLRDIEQL